MNGGVLCVYLNLGDDVMGKLGEAIALYQRAGCNPVEIRLNTEDYARLLADAEDMIAGPYADIFMCVPVVHSEITWQGRAEIGLRPWAKEML